MTTTNSFAHLDLDSKYGCLIINNREEYIHPAIREFYGNDVLDFVCYNENKPVLTVEIGESFRNKIDSLNQNKEKREDIINVFNVLSPFQKKITYSLCTFMVQLYLRGMGKEHELFVVPYVIGWMWQKCADSFGLPTVATYSALVLYNACVKNWQEEITLENMTVLHAVTSTVDEVWFYKIHILLEFDGGKLFPIFLNPENYFTNEQTSIETLENMKKILKNLTCTLKRMNDHCKPIIYWDKIRFYFEGYNTGLQLEIDEHYQTIRDHLPTEKFYHKGGSGAQSCIFQTLDNFLGIPHGNFHGKDFLESQKFYMSEGHREFLNCVKTTKNLKTILDEQKHLENENIITKYNEMLSCFKIYRDVHFGLVHTYMISFLKKDVKVDTFKGTGGADLSWLKDYSKDVENAKLNNKVVVDGGDKEKAAEVTKKTTTMTTKKSQEQKSFLSLEIWQWVVLSVLVGIVLFPYLK
jgi:hypothetical protein